ncbi:hypothetical protein CEW46_21195 [Bacillus cereus]|nr:hypothetical protein CEW46_21195 [Bacillus cereus]
MISYVVEAGTTVRVQSKFTSFEGVLIDPEVVRVEVYDNSMKTKLDEATLSESNHSSTGKYFYDYTTQEVEDTFYIKFIGEINGHPNISRLEVVTRFKPIR